MIRTMPKAFPDMIVKYGDPEAKAPSGFGANAGYVNCWNNAWLSERLFNQWRYAHAIATGKQPAKNWFYPDGFFGETQQPEDWKTTAMHVMNAEYAGNASYEWFEWKEDEKGERQMYRVNQFNRIPDTSDLRLKNPYLDYLFARPDITVSAATRDFKRFYEKQN